MQELSHLLHVPRDTGARVKFRWLKAILRNCSVEERSCVNMRFPQFLSSQQRSSRTREFERRVNSRGRRNEGRDCEIGCYCRSSISKVCMAFWPDTANVA